jgi:hypothetical protein
MFEDLSSAQNVLRDKLEYISQNFVEVDFRNNLVFRGTNTTAPFTDISLTNYTAPTDQVTLNDLVVALHSGFSDFERVFGNDIVTTTAVDNNILYRDTKNANSAYATGTLSTVNTHLGATTELSLTKFVNPNSALALRLSKIRRLYSLLEGSNYSKYQQLIANKNINTIRLEVSDFLVGNNHVGKYIVNAPVSTSRTATDNQTSLTYMKNTILDLMSARYASTSSLIANGLTHTNLNVTNFTSLINNDANKKIKYALPANIQDNIVCLSPISASPKEGYTASIPIMNINDSKERWITVSFYTRMRQDVNNNISDMAPGNVEAFIFLDDVDKSYTPSVLSKGTPWYENRAFTVSNEWHRVSVTRRIKFSPDSNGNLPKGNVSFRIDNNHNGETRQHILITGLQVDVSESPTHGPSTFKVPLFGENTNLFVVRRLLLMYELMATYYIAVKVLTANYETASQANKDKYALFVDTVYKYINNFNKNLLSTTKDPVTNALPPMAQLTQDINTKIADFRKNSKDINELDVQVSDMKTVLKGEMDSLAGKQSTLKKTKTFLIVSLVMALVIVLASVVTYLLPIDQHKKLMIVGVVVALAVVATVVFNLVYSKNVENFAQCGATLSDPGTCVGGAIMAQNKDFKVNASLSLADWEEDYLTNTVNLALMLQTYVGYGNINYAMQKEKGHYIRVQQQLDTSGYQVSQISNVFNLQSYTNRARVSFFITLGVLVSITVATLVATSKLPTLRPWILGVASVVLVLSVVFYIMDTSGRVRTSAEKVYWGTPDTSKL